jgi:hypothetical protein
MQSQGNPNPGERPPPSDQLAPTNQTTSSNSSSFAYQTKKPLPLKLKTEDKDGSFPTSIPGPVTGESAAFDPTHLNQQDSVRYNWIAQTSVEPKAQTQKFNFQN